MEKNIKNEIMGQIKSGKLSMRARWVYIAGKIGLESGLALTAIVIIFSLNLFFYYIKSNGLLPSLHNTASFGGGILHALPYDLILAILVLGALLNFIVKKFDFSYKKSFVFIMSIMLGSIIIGASALFASDFNSLMRNKIEENNINLPYITDFYMNRCGCWPKESPIMEGPAQGGNNSGGAMSGRNKPGGNGNSDNATVNGGCGMMRN